MAEMQDKEQLISSILDELKELEMLTEGMNNPRLLEELALKKAKSLVGQYERLKEMDESQLGTTDAEQPAALKTPIDKPAETVIEQAAPVMPEPVVIVQEPEVRPQPVVVQQPVIIEHVVTPAVEKPTEPTNVEVKEDKAPERVQQPIADSKWQQSSVQTNNDRFKQSTPGTSNKRLIDNMFNKSLKSFLNFNDKIRYSRELFGGDTSLMNTTIEELDHMSSLGDALAYINAKFNWNKNDEAVGEFLALLERRF